MLRATFCLFLPLLPLHQPDPHQMTISISLLRISRPQRLGSALFKSRGTCISGRALSNEPAFSRSSPSSTPFPSRSTLLAVSSSSSRSLLRDSPGMKSVELTYFDLPGSVFFSTRAPSSPPRSSPTLSPPSERSSSTISLHHRS